MNWLMRIARWEIMKEACLLLGMLIQKQRLGKIPAGLA